MIKTSQTNPQFERSFADLAYAVLKDKAPKLLDYMVGFQVVDKNEEDTKAAGVFGFKVGKQWFYAPMFFLNGELKGSELLYIKGQDNFVPLQENWVNYLINRKPMVLGERVPYKEQDIYAAGPDFSIFSRSPIRNSFDKVSAHSACTGGSEGLCGSVVMGEAFDLEPALRCFTVSPNGPTFKEAAERSDLRNVIKEVGRPASRYLVQLMGDFPKLAGVLSKYYSGEDLLPPGRAPVPIRVTAPSAQALEKAGLSRREFNWWVKRAMKGDQPSKPVSILLKEAGVNGLRDIRPVYPQLIAEPNEELPSIAPSGARVCVLTKSSNLDSLELSDDERTAIMVDGYAVRDERSDLEKTAVYLEEDMHAGEVDEPAMYFLLTKTAEARPHICCDGLIIDPKTASWRTYAPTEELPVLSHADTEAWHTEFNKLPSISSMEKGAAYVIFSNTGTTYGPLLVKEADGATFKASGCEDHWKYKLVVGGTETSARRIGDTLFMPPTSRVMKVASRESLADGIGSPSDVHVFLTKTAGMELMTVWSNGSDYQLEFREAFSSPKPLVKSASTLIREYGVTKAAAQMMLSAAHKDGSSTFFIKQSQQSLGQPGGYLGPGHDAPAVNGLDNLAQYDSRLGVPVEYHSSELAPVENYDTYNNEEIYNPLTTDPRAQTAAIQAADMGQKEVLDTSVLAGLVKAMDTDPIVDKYLGDLVVGQDRLGRLLFMFYWHNDKFRERYGDDEMAELEDSLRNVFKGTGDLVLFLKKKSIEPDASLIGSDVDLKETPV